MKLAGGPRAHRVVTKLLPKRDFRVGELVQVIHAFNDDASSWLWATITSISGGHDHIVFNLTTGGGTYLMNWPANWIRKAVLGE